MKRKFKNIASIILVSILMLIAGNSVQAQQGRQQGPPPTPTDDQIEEMVEDLDKALSLSDKQEIQVSEKYFAHFAAVDKKMKAGRPNRDDMEAMKTDFEKEIKSLLTKSQQDLYSTYLKKQQKQRK